MHHKPGRTRKPNAAANALNVHAYWIPGLAAATRRHRHNRQHRDVKALTNSEIAELLAREATSAQQPLERALRRAARRALLWPEEVAEMLKKGRSLTELAGIGPYLSKLITGWLESPPEIASPPPIRQNFITLPEARSLLSKDPGWIQRIKGDLQTHTRWSDGSGSLQEMASVAMQRGYEYLAITDHSKGLRIARGIDPESAGPAESRNRYSQPIYPVHKAPVQAAAFDRT
jgi:hypothetical protein